MLKYNKQDTKREDDDDGRVRDELGRLSYRNRDLEDQLKKLQGEVNKLLRGNDELKRELKLKEELEGMRGKEKDNIIDNLRKGLEQELKKAAQQAKDLEEKSRECKAA